MVYTAGKIRQYMRVDQAPFFFIAILSAFKSFLTADIYRYTEHVRIDLNAVKMRLKKIFASPRAQHTQAQERSGGEGSYYAYLQIVIYP